MREIFTDLYKKVLGFFQTQEEEKQENAKDVAVNRMKLVLMQDRTNLTPFLLEKMRGEMIEVLAKYVEMDKEALELNFEQEGEQMALMLSIPVIRAKDEDEIQAALDAEETKEEETSDEQEVEEKFETEEIKNEVEAETEESEDAETAEEEAPAEEDTTVETEEAQLSDDDKTEEISEEKAKPKKEFSSKKNKK